MKRSKLSRRITWCVIGIMSFFNVLIIGAILMFVFEISFANSNTRGQNVMSGIAGNMETMMQVAKTAVFNNRVDIEANMDTPEHVFEALKQILQVNKQLAGCFVAFEPNYFKGQGRWFEAYAYHADSTHIGLRQIGSPQHDYFNGVWYQKGLALKRSDNGYLTDLYYDDTVNSGMFCSYVVPIFDLQGRKVGVYGVDLNLNRVDGAIKKAMDVVKDEFLLDDEDSNDFDNEILFSIQVLDGKGNRITGTDSLDIGILKNKQKKAGKAYDIKDLKKTPYYINSMQLGQTGWTLTVFQHYELVFFWGIMLAIAILLCMGVGAIIIFFFTTRSIRRATKPLGFLSESAQEVAKGNFDAPLPTFKHNDEVAQLRDSFDTMQQSLKQYVEKLQTTTAAKASIESELNVAHNIQMSMLPKTFPAFPDRKDIELYASLTPAKAVGGDLYDFFIHNDKLFFCIGDVSGKGVPASLVMAVSRTLFRNIAAHTDQPSHIVETMNMNICEGNDNCMFVTLFVGVLDLSSGRLRYCNAGHDAPYLGNELLTCVPNLPVGVATDLKFSEQEAMIAPGKILFLYTDGLTEAENSSRNLFGMERVDEVIATFEGSPQELIETMTAAVHQFVGDTEQSDDITMLAFRIRK